MTRFGRQVVSLEEKMRNKEYRDGYVAANVRHWVSTQIRLCAQQRGMTKHNLSVASGLSEGDIDLVEDPDETNVDINELLALASAMDVALSIQFVDYPTFVDRTSDLSKEAFEVNTFEDVDADIDALYDSPTGSPS